MEGVIKSVLRGHVSKSQAGLAALDKHAKILAVAALRRGIPASVHRFSETEWMLRLMVGSVAYQYYQGALLRGGDGSSNRFGPHIDGVGADIAANKALTLTILAGAGLSVPKGKAFASDEQGKALDYALKLGRAVCIKPLDSKNANAAYPKLTEAADIKEAIGRAARLSHAVSVQESVGPFEMRYFYTAPRITGLKTSTPLTAEGDGVSTVRALLGDINEERRRRDLPSHDVVPIGEDMLLLLKSQRLTPDTVPEKGRRVALTWTGNGVKGGISSDGRGIVHPSYAAVAKAAFDAIPSLVYGAVDMMVRSYDLPAAPDNYWILELNASPGIAAFLYPWEGQKQDMGDAILDLLKSDAASSGK